MTKFDMLIKVPLFCDGKMRFKRGERQKLTERYVSMLWLGIGDYFNFCVNSKN